MQLTLEEIVVRFCTEVSINFVVDLHREFRIDRRLRPQVYLRGTGCVYDSETHARYFQIEQRYPFDPKELTRDHTLLIRHVSNEMWKDVKRGLREKGVKESERCHLLITPDAPPVWITTKDEPELKGAVQANCRFTVAFPDVLPFGCDAVPQLILPKDPDALDVHEQILQNQSDAAHELKESRRKIKELFTLDMDAGKWHDEKCVNIINPGGEPHRHNKKGTN